MFVSFINCLLFLLFQVTTPNTILNKISAFESNPKFVNTIVVATIKDCNSGENYLNHSSFKSINSASTLKLLTTATAFELLGKDYIYKTEVSYSGKIIDKRLNGNLYFQGFGDPTFGNERLGESYSSIFRKIQNALVEHGINEIDGDIILMNSEFENFDISETWAWNDIGNYYGASPYRININENYFKTFFNAGNGLGEQASIVKIEPSSASWKIINQVTTAENGSGDNVYIYSAPMSNLILMKGTIPLGAKNFSVKGAIPNPPMLFGEILKKEFQSIDFTISGEIKLQSYLSSGLTNLITVESKPLAEIIKQCNYYSINLYADALIKTIGLEKRNSFSYQQGIEETIAFWNFKGVDTSFMNLKDGSGLSAQGTITTELICSVLSEMSKSTNYQVFLNSIPVLGKSGTVSRIGRGTKAEGKVFVKSGSIEGTRAFAGYFTNSEGKLMSFMIAVNRFNKSQTQEVNQFLNELLVELGKS